MTAHRFTIGTFDALIVTDGAAPRPASSFLSDVPQAALEDAAQQLGLDAASLDFSRNILVLRRGDQIIVADTGMGAGRDGVFGRRLAEQGIGAEQVTHIIITHGHLDHIGGIIDDSGTFIYPNARYLISAEEWYFSTRAEAVAEDTPPNAIWRALMAHSERVTLLDLNGGSAEIVPGVTAIPAFGHTVGHIALLVESSGDTLLDIVDAAHTPLQALHPDWSPKFDHDKAQAAETRRALFERAARDNILTLTYHLPFPGLGRYHSRGGAFLWERA